MTTCNAVKMSCEDEKDKQNSSIRHSSLDSGSLMTLDGDVVVDTPINNGFKSNFTDSQFNLEAKCSRPRRKDMDVPINIHVNTSTLKGDSIGTNPCHDSLVQINAKTDSEFAAQPVLMQSFPGDNVPSGEILKSSQIHPYLQQQQQQQFPYDLHHSVHSSVYGVTSASSRYPADLHDRNQPLHLPDFGVTRSSTHSNPYASTFEKPLTSKFSSSIFKPEKDLTYSNKHDYPSSLSHVSVDERGNGPRQGISSPFSASGVGKVLPRPGDVQYDPLVDSIEPSNSYKKSDYVQNWEPPGSSDIAPSLKQSNRPLDVEENNKKKDFGGIALATSRDNEELGETADAEVGVVENGSQSNSDALANTDIGEMEIDQIKSPGKSKKSKESRSMKLFKVCLADFVKEVLKPSWRQGNMSKEAFKTVVKKTVDKVSGAMNSHRVPKSKVKITQYIDSSRRKLTKLVMGYVDKYAKG